MKFFGTAFLCGCSLCCTRCRLDYPPQFGKWARVPPSDLGANPKERQKSSLHKTQLLTLYMKSFGVTIEIKPRQQFFYMLSTVSSARLCFFLDFFTAFCPLGSKRVNSLWGACNYGSLPSIHLLLGYFLLSSETSFSRIAKTARQRALCCRSAAAPVMKRGEKNLRGQVNVKFNIFLR